MKNSLIKKGTKCAVSDCEKPATTGAEISINNRAAELLPVCLWHKLSAEEDRQLANRPALRAAGALVVYFGKKGDVTGSFDIEEIAGIIEREIKSK